MYVYLSTTYGWTFEQIRQMTPKEQLAAIRSPEKQKQGIVTFKDKRELEQYRASRGK
jgi:hypothetical protein